MVSQFRPVGGLEMKKNALGDWRGGCLMKKIGNFEVLDSYVRIFGALSSMTLRLHDRYATSLVHLPLKCLQK